MTDCCESSCNPPRKFRCPVNGKEYGSVSVKTILHHINEPWKSVLESKAYYFCSDAKCDVVYFGQDNSVIKKNELRSKVGIKQNIPGRTICYCFGVSYSAAKENNTIVNFVKDKTKKALCSCETSNPSGQCCLKDFPKQ
jgi:YHS domain-containing protein